MSLSEKGIGNAMRVVRLSIADYSIEGEAFASNESLPRFSQLTSTLFKNAGSGHDRRAENIVVVMDFSKVESLENYNASVALKLVIEEWGIQRHNKRIYALYDQLQYDGSQNSVWGDFQDIVTKASQRAIVLARPENTPTFQLTGVNSEKKERFRTPFDALTAQSTWIEARSKGSILDELVAARLALRVTTDGRFLYRSLATFIT